MSRPETLLQLDTQEGTLNTDVVMKGECTNSSVKQEQFVQAFRKPTLIYRCLQHRHNVIIIQRNLLYMCSRLSRSNHKQKRFKLISLPNGKDETQNVPKFLNIIFEPFSERAETENLFVGRRSFVIESKLCKISKSEGSSLEYATLAINKCEFKCSLDGYRTSTFCTSLMSPIEDQYVIYKILFNIRALAKIATEDGEITINEPNSAYWFEISAKDKFNGLICEGDYKASLYHIDSDVTKPSSEKDLFWTHVSEITLPISIKQEYTQSKKIKFRVTWSNTEIPKKISTADYAKFERLLSNAHEPDSTGNIIGKPKASYILPQQSPEKMVVEFVFCYSNNTRQVTEFVQEPTCPWCGLKCLKLYSLIKHLKLCHSRFNFTYQGGTRIEITINNSYDGTYYGSPFDLVGPSRYCFLQHFGPKQRTSATIIFIWRPRNLKLSLDEFMDLEDEEGSNQRPYINGHCRLYYHTETCLPIYPSELEYDSESEVDPDWLRKKTVQMIDDFSDVNEGEKEIMKAWNLHLMKHGFVGDHQLPMACLKFLLEKGDFIVTSNLYRNFLAHMSAMVDYGVISPEHVHQYYLQIQTLIGQSQERRDMISRQIQEQSAYWLKHGDHRQTDPSQNFTIDSIEPTKSGKISKSKSHNNKRIYTGSAQTKANIFTEKSVNISLLEEGKNKISSNVKALIIKHNLESQNKRMRINYD